MDKPPLIKRTRRVFAISLLVVLIIGAFVVTSDREPPAVAPDLALNDSLVPPPPKDDVAAAREIAKTRKALDKLKPRSPYIVVDTQANLAYWRTADSVMFIARCSTGSGAELIDSTTGRTWIFNTPHGVFSVKHKLSNPWWRKPDWAFIEENEPIPKNPSERFDNDVLGDFALGFGDGFFIHGTLYERLLGINVTHGCVRLGSDDLKFIYDRAKIGTPIYIF